jgi:Lar family restriction alleviation protein
MSEMTLELMALRNNKPTVFETGGKKLTPCPFCWSDDITIFDTGEDPNSHRCLCLTCHSAGPWRDSRLNAIATWNRRGGWEMP